MFLGAGVGFVFFWWVFAYVFALFLAVRSRKCLEKILLLSGLVFFLGSFFLPFVFSSTSFFFFSRDIAQVVTGHPHSRTCVAGSFSFCVPPLLSVSPVLAVRPASRRFSRGAILGPA